MNNNIMLHKAKIAQLGERGRRYLFISQKKMANIITDTENI